VSEAEEIAREEAEIGEGMSGALEGLIADEIASEEAFIGEGLSGEGEKVAALDEIRAEELAVGEGLSGAAEDAESDERREILAEEKSFLELSGAVLSEEDEIAAEERAIGEGVSGDAQRLEGALESGSRSEQEEIEEEMRLILEGVSGDAAAIKAADDMAAAPVRETFQGLFSALRSADVNKALRYARGLGLKKAEGICNVDGKRTPGCQPLSMGPDWKTEATHRRRSMRDGRPQGCFSRLRMIVCNSKTLQCICIEHSSFQRREFGTLALD
jgi:hypothetical protein